VSLLQLLGRMHQAKVVRIRASRARVPPLHTDDARSRTRRYRPRCAADGRDETTAKLRHRINLLSWEQRCAVCGASL